MISSHVISSHLMASNIYLNLRRILIMTIRRMLAIVALPILVSTFGYAAASSALNTGRSAQSSTPLAQNTDQTTPQKPRHRGPDLAAAAQKLGISEATLKAALGVPANPPAPSTSGQRPPRPDLKAAAAKLGITEQKLTDALGVRHRHPRPDFAAAAQKLGVTEAQLKTALGVPANPPAPGTAGQRLPRPDFQAAAAKLGVTEQQLKDALGVPPRPPGDDDAPQGANRSPS
jgi:hypothetical protein